jgi:cation diffusion facilitator family transporter
MALRLSLIAILTIAIVNTILGLVTNSLAVLGNAAHALFDTWSSVILLVTTQLSVKPPDAEHLYGHGKIESIGGLLAGVSFIVVSGILGFEAVMRLITGVGQVHRDMIGFLAIGYTFAIDFFRIAILWEKKSGSVTVIAGLYHALTDFASAINSINRFWTCIH